MNYNQLLIYKKKRVLKNICLKFNLDAGSQYPVDSNRQAIMLFHILQPCMKYP